MLDVYIFENIQLLEKLESLLLIYEKNESFSTEQIADIFRILHTIKGSSAMMNFDNVANISHALEDLFDFLRAHETRKEDYHKIIDLSITTLDIIKTEMSKIQNGGLPDTDVAGVIDQIKEFYDVLTNRKIPAATQQPCETVETQEDFFDGLLNGAENEGYYYKAHVSFQNDCKMENIRALGIVKSLENICSKILTEPNDLLADNSEDEIVENGLTLYMASETSEDDIVKKIQETFFIKKLAFKRLDASDIAKLSALKCNKDAKRANDAAKAADTANTVKQNFMSVNLNKLDLLMDIVGEIVITESTVTKNPEITKLHLDSFEKASRQLHKLTDELQDIVMSIRMIPVSATFHKMERIVRDMSAKINKQAILEIIGEETELDKNVLDHLSDPLMHIIRNAMDHGLETADERIGKNKNPVGRIVLEARNTGGDVLIIISDDGHGLNKDELIDIGIKKGLIKKPKAEVTDKEAYSLIFAPGFSTKKQVTEFSGRGVGMDVALKNIEKMGGGVSVSSTPDQGMSVQIRIPLTLAIIDGMQVSVGRTSYIIPLLTIKESFKPVKKDIFRDTSGNEMIHTRGNVYPIIRLHELFRTETQVTDFEDGILMIVEAETQTYCLFVDNLVGEQQTVVKPMPAYIKNMGNIKSIAGCTILGDGNISLIIDINGLFC
ncbi:MAG: chemotaxis protein CheA [Eubacteriales bacterium]|nr:chemotaxis protein CheA [Eubacteriales bacterium]